MYSSISFLIILPLSPEPEIFDRSIPFSSASFFANGDALILSSFEFIFFSSGAGAGAGAGAGVSTLTSISFSIGVSFTFSLLSTLEVSF